LFKFNFVICKLCDARFHQNNQHNLNIHLTGLRHQRNLQNFQSSRSNNSSNLPQRDPQLQYPHSNNSHLQPSSPPNQRNRQLPQNSREQFLAENPGLYRIVRIVAKSIENFDRTRGGGGVVRESFGYGHFNCVKCPIEWSSYECVITINCRKLYIARWWKQKCRSCKTPSRPNFETKELIRLIESALTRFMKSDNNHPPYTRPPKKLESPHDSKNCEKCEYGPNKLHR